MFNLSTEKSEDQVIEEGAYAANLLGDPTFQDIMDSLAQQCAEGFLLTQPHQERNRVEAYNLYSGLLAIKAELEHRVQQKDLIEAQRDADQRSAS